jgi:hypothetical protein
MSVVKGLAGHTSRKQSQTDLWDKIKNEEILDLKRGT